MSRVSFFVHDLAANPIVRAAPLAMALRDRHEVEILGLLHGEDIYAPYRDVLEFRALRCPREMTAVMAAMPRLAAMATGDVMYACKPLVTTLGPALMASRLGHRRPLLLDVEDDEWVPMGEGWPDFVARDLVGGWRHATAWKYTRLLHPLTRCADAVTVSSRLLQRRYGGVMVLHGPDESLFDPESAPSRADARARFGLPADAPLALFAGMPQPHKGFEALRAALQQPQARGWHLVLAGAADYADFVACAEALPGRCHRVGFVTQADMPALLAAVDAVPVPQRRVRFAESQVPAKALEAMAMAKAVVGTRVGDTPHLLGEGDRGWLVEPDDAAALADALAAVAARPADVARRGAAARTWYLAHASRRALAATLVPLITRTLVSRN